MKKIVRICTMSLMGLLMMVLFAAPLRGQDLGALKSLATSAWKGEAAGKVVLSLLLGHLDLTPEQKQQAKTIIETRRASLQTLFKQLRAENRALAKRLLVPGEIRLNTLALQIQRITHIREQLLREGLTTVLAVRAILTPEQWAKAEQLKAQIESLQSSFGGGAP